MTALYSARFLRAHPPLDEGLRACLQGAVRDGALAAFLLWGVSDKPGPDEHDDRTMAHLDALLARLDATLRCHTVFTLLLCDSHAELNCVQPEAAGAYAGGVATRAEGRGWQVLRMSALWRDGGITLDHVDRLAAQLDVAETLPRLARFAFRHYRGADPHAGARRYLAARLLEKPVLARRFARSIHLSPTEPTLALVQPALPTLSIWTERKGCSAKPWFAQREA